MGTEHEQRIAELEQLVKRKRTPNSNHEFKRYPNLVMDLVIERPDQVWVGDITYIRLQQEFVYF